MRGAGTGAGRTDDRPLRHRGIALQGLSASTFEPGDALILLADPFSLPVDAIIDALATLELPGSDDAVSIPVAEAMSRTEPDGYTLMVSGIPIIVVGPAMNKNVGYDPMRDLTHIAYFGGTPNMLAVHRSLGTRTYAEFLAYARKQPGGTDYVSA